MGKLSLDNLVDRVPREFASLLSGVNLYDRSSSPEANTVFIDGKIKAFLKMGTSGGLRREREMSCFLHSHHLAPRVIDYICRDGKDYLVTEALPGYDGIDVRHQQNPQRLAEVFGQSLKLLHSLPIERCPFAGRSAELIALTEENISLRRKDDEIVGESIEEAAERFASLKHLARDEVVIHGDFCLPNIIMQDYRLSGFVDLGWGGIGDRHYDIWWGIWTLEYNLHSDAFRDAFLNAYGKGDVDEDRLELNRLIAGLTI